MVRATQFAGILVFNICWVFQRIGRAAMAALHACDLTLWDSHFVAPSDIESVVFSRDAAPGHRHQHTFWVISVWIGG